MPETTDPAAAVPPGTYAGGARSPVCWVYLCPSCAGYAPAVPSGLPVSQCQGCGSYCYPELHRFPAYIDSAAGCGCRESHPGVTGDLAARPALDDSARFQVEEAREMLAGFAAAGRSEVFGTERTLYDHGRALLDLLDKIAPKETADDRP